jgi:hypothetical protein
LENVFHVTRYFVPAKNAIEPLWPSLGEASEKAENRRKVSPRIVFSNPRRVQTRAVKSENLLARQLDNGGIFRAGAHANAADRWGGSLTEAPRHGGGLSGDADTRKC